jgi:hypothetical protein
LGRGAPAIAARVAGTAQVVNPGGPAESAAAVDNQRAMIAKIAQALASSRSSGSPAQLISRARPPPLDRLRKAPSS